MKTRCFFTSILLVSCIFVESFAQNDDLYFIPTVKKQDTEKDKSKQTQEQESTSSYSNNEEWDVDAYNRRYATSPYINNDTVYIDDEQDIESSDWDESESLLDDNYTYSRRLLFFHAPTIGVLVSSPYYWDLCYTSYYDTFYYWNDPFYIVGWHPYPWFTFHWHTPWYDPWWHRPPIWNRPPLWGHRPPRPHNPIHGHHIVNTRRGPVGGVIWNSGRRSAVNRPASSYQIRPDRKSRRNSNNITRPNNNNDNKIRTTRPSSLNRNRTDWISRPNSNNRRTPTFRPSRNTNHNIGRPQRGGGRRR